MMDAPISNYQHEFDFFARSGADESMIDYAKMAILFAFQKEYDTIFKKCEIIRFKFEEKYGGKWVVGMFQNNYSDVSSYYDQFCLCVQYNNYTFKIFKVK